VKPNASILISSYNRTPLFRRTLWSIMTRPPTDPFEVVVADDGSAEDILGLMRQFKFPWTLVRFHREQFEAETGLKKYWNCPAVTNNIAFNHSSGDLIYQMGNDIIAHGDVFDKLKRDIPTADGCEVIPPPYWMVMSTTYNMPKFLAEKLNATGTNLTDAMVAVASQWPLQSIDYRSDVTNYISLAPRGAWEKLNGYNEEYYGGISKEDSDFVRRARHLPEFKQVISKGISLHQYHDGKTCYYDPPPTLITKRQWDDGVAINKAIYDRGVLTYNNPQPWPIGSFGVGEVIRENYDE
jgi:glycosyltransferase involved in cell wall biosynthesis